MDYFCSYSMNQKAFTSLAVLFLSLEVLFFLLWIFIKDPVVDYRVLLGGNLLLFIVGMISLRMNSSAMKHQNTQGFLRLMYGAFILKFFVVAIVAFVYISIFKKAVNKPALFGCFGLYLIYTFLEMRSVLKQSKKPNA
jgi:hypothetical protein